MGKGIAHEVDAAALPAGKDRDVHVGLLGTAVSASRPSAASGAGQLLHFQLHQPLEAARGRAASLPPSYTIT